MVNVKAFGWRLPLHVFPSQLIELLAVAMLAALLATLLPIIRLMRLEPASLVKIFANERLIAFTQRAVAAVLELARLLGCWRCAQGFADWAARRRLRRRRRRGRRLRDHGLPDRRIEWWYLTANLTDSRGGQWGAQWTLFRQEVLKPTIEETTNLKKATETAR